MPDNTPRVSVVLPTYRPGEYLREAIESALAQGYPDTEVIVIDDASPEECRPTLDALAARYPITLLRRPKNGGPAAGHNTGIRAARGEFIAFLEHDDLFLPGKLARQVEALQAHPDWGVCAAGFVEIDAAGKRLGEPAIPACGEEEMLRELLAHNILFSLSQVVARRLCLEELGGMDESFRIAHDYDLWVRVALSRWRIGWVRERLLGYRRHEASFGARSQERGIEETIRVLEKARIACPERRSWGMKHDARSWYRLGKVRLRRGARAEARECFRRAFAADPLCWKAYLRWLLGWRAR